MNMEEAFPGKPWRGLEADWGSEENLFPDQSEATLRSGAALPDLAIITHSSLSLVSLKCLSDSSVFSNGVFFNLVFLFFSAESRISVSLCTL